MRRLRPAACLPAIRRGLLVLLLAAGPAAPAAWAQGTIMQAPAPPSLPTGRATAPAAPAAPAIARPPLNTAVQFDYSERWLIPRYFQDIRDRQRRASRYKVYPHDLPAGLTQQPAAGDILPPAIVAEMTPLPKPLIRELPRVRPDTARYIAGRDVLLVQRSSGKVLDVLNNVVH